MDSDHLPGVQTQGSAAPKPLHPLPAGRWHRGCDSRVQTPTQHCRSSEHPVGFQGGARGDSALSPGAVYPGGAGGPSSALL